MARRGGRTIALLVALAGCDQGAKPTLPRAATGSATIAPRDAATADVALPGAAVPASRVTLPAKPAFGCLGWAHAAKTAVCITGHRLWNQLSAYTLEFVSTGDPPREPLDLHLTEFDEAFDPAVIATASQTLAAMQLESLPTAALKIDKPGTHPIGTTARLVWTSKLTHPGGDNMAPTHKHDAVVRCGGRTYAVAVSELEGVDPAFEVRFVDGHAIIETTLNTAREGEYGAAVSVLVLDLATCHGAQSVD